MNDLPDPTPIENLFQALIIWLLLKTDGELAVSLDKLQGVIHKYQLEVRGTDDLIVEAFLSETPLKLYWPSDN